MKLSPSGSEGMRSPGGPGARPPASLVDLLTVHADRRGRGDPEANAIPPDRHDRDANRAVENEHFPDPSRQNEHGRTSLDRTDALFEATPSNERRDRPSRRRRT